MLQSRFTETTAPTAADNIERLAQAYQAWDAKPSFDPGDVVLPADFIAIPGRDPQPSDYGFVMETCLSLRAMVGDKAMSDAQGILVAYVHPQHQCLGFMWVGAWQYVKVPAEALPSRPLNG